MKLRRELKEKESIEQRLKELENEAKEKENAYRDKYQNAQSRRKE